jgi:hypothetical protein
VTAGGGGDDEDANVMKDLFWPLTMTVMTMTMQIMMKDLFWPLTMTVIDD